MVKIAFKGDTEKVALTKRPVGIKQPSVHHIVGPTTDDRER